MKKQLLLLAILYSQISFSQITITSSDMPVAGDTARRTVVATTVGLNYQATGANQTWNFTNLRYQSQQVDTFLSVSSTNFLYALFFSNLPFNQNRANVATSGTAFPSNPLITITDPYNFYYRSSSSYQQVGLGATFQGIPLPVAYTQKDKIYEFPLNFGDVDTSVSAWNISLPSLIYYGSNQTRINQVDGWGTLNTPYGSYQALRVKTTLIASDTIALDSINFGLSIDRPLTREYKWLVNGEIVPVLQVTTTEIFGIEIISSILFRDVVPNVTPAVLPTAICAGSTFQLPYTEQGTFNAAALFTAGNKFTAQLSDASGSFSNPVNIGDTTYNKSGDFSVLIPANTPAGNGYRIRIISTNPAVIGPDNGIDIRIDNGLPAASSVTPNGPLTFCYPGTVTLSGTSVSDATYQWTLNGNTINGASSSDFVASTAGTYILNTSNSCGSTASNSTVVVIDSLPLAAAISATGSLNFCYGDSVQLNGSSSNAAQYQWVLNGVDITGATSLSIYAQLAGDYVLNAINNCGVTSSNIISVNVDSLPLASVISAAGNLSFCDGNSIVLNGSAFSNVQYQWTLNGSPVNGATLPALTVNQTGLYVMNTINACGTTASNTLQATANPLPPTPLITSSNDTLFTSGGYSYIWYLNGNILQGAVDSFYVAGASGVYTVSIMNLDSCSSISSPFNFVASGINSFTSFITLNLYPNPVQDVMNFQVQTAGSYTVEMLSVDGKLMLSTQEILEQESKLYVPAALENGTYLIRIRNEKLNYMQRFVVNR